MSTISVHQNLLDGVLRYVEVSSLTTKRALDEVGVHRQAQEKAAALRQELLDHMVKTRTVEAGQKEAAAVMLGAHDTTMQLLKAAVDKIAEQDAAIRKLTGGTKTAGDLGQGVNANDIGVSASGSHQNAGEYNSLTNPIVGEKTANLKESDKALLRLAGK